jgi:hypothetical protein
MPYRRLTGALAAAAALVSGVAISASAHASDFSVATMTYCSKGSVVKLSASESYGKLAVTLNVNGSASGAYWSAGIVENLTGVYGGLPRADGNGDFTVNAVTADQAGTDNFGASAFNWRTGEVCAATVAL